MAGGAYRKLDAIEGRGPKLHITWLERRQTDCEIRAAVKYCKKDNYLAFAYGVETKRVARLREEVESKTTEYSYYNFKGMREDGTGLDSLSITRKAAEHASKLLHSRLMAAYQQRAENDNCTLEQAAFAMGMRP